MPDLAGLAPANLPLKSIGSFLKGRWQEKANFKDVGKGGREAQMSKSNFNYWQVVRTINKAVTM